MEITTLGSMFFAFSEVVLVAVVKLLFGCLYLTSLLQFRLP